jgi:hypothetical protein
LTIRERELLESSAVHRRDVSKIDDANQPALTEVRAARSLQITLQTSTNEPNLVTSSNLTTDYDDPFLTDRPSPSQAAGPVNEARKTPAQHSSNSDERTQSCDKSHACNALKRRSKNQPQIRKTNPSSGKSSVNRTQFQRDFHKISSIGNTHCPNLTNPRP